MSWWELSLYVHRYEIFLQRENDKEEAHWARFRIQWSDFRNANFKKKTKPQDLIKLSTDKEKQEAKPTRLSQKEKKEMFGSKFKKT